MPPPRWLPLIVLTGVVLLWAGGGVAMAGPEGVAPGGAGDAGGLGFGAWFTLGLTAAVLLTLVRDWASPDVVFLGAAVLLALVGVLEPAEAFAGFANPGVLTVAGMFVVAAALRETGVLDVVGDRLLGRVGTARGARARLAGLVIPSSAVVNNTPIVAMLMPVVVDWCRRMRVSPSTLLMHLSFLSILGGCCTLIGTSTNLVVHGLLLKQGASGLGFLELGYAGIPCALVGAAYLLWVAPRLMPERKDVRQQLSESRREYLSELRVAPECKLVGKTVEEAGLRHLPGLFLIEIDRDGEAIGPVEPDVEIHAGDRLVFTGDVSTITELEKIPGLMPAAQPDYEISGGSGVDRPGHRLCEAVVSSASPLVNTSVREAGFRGMYDAAVVAVHRNGDRLTGKVGDIVLRPGDTLLLQVGPDFSRGFRDHRDFYLVSEVEGSTTPRHRLAGIAAAITGLLVLAIASGLVEPAVAALLAGGLMVASRCLNRNDALRSVEWPVLLAIASSLALAEAMSKTGAAAAGAELLVSLTRSLGPVATLAALYFGTMILNELVTNNAAAALAFPLALESARVLGVEPRPFVIAITLAASFAFASPIGYQTHMMVYGPGGYRYGDFVRVGVPLNLLLWVSATILVPLIWSF
ncbi:SLC13 family permease [Tautonia plasticadhaerens]|uniref:Potassium transporter peripheral membrane component n=1 Tax=Tautonia plasticadhaerens TaxID=2527974 RepID=A0A518H2K9_9BACT|nr:SLC13 family permease [Tautonia plasticadhaerens]QDV35078.1 potassium transporter peripheral membrane component [Tautonia plasticadhaerens]